ncbi:MAG: TIR domain-containing protein [Candidatus Anammoximicrobium sp.]|nr:TIR domain-containing protein [Candidatus Anammoximicrobium sp.]
MAYPEHVELVKQGAEAIREWREEHPDVPLDLGQADLRQTNLVGANLSEADLAGANLSGTNLRAAALAGADLRKADLRGVDLRGANLSGADLQGADLSAANLSGADLHMAHLSEAHLRGAKLVGTNLMWANLIGADLDETHAHGANLCETLLCGATLRAADLSQAKLGGACLGGATVKRANLHRANLHETSFHGTYLSSTLFADVDLSVAKKLDTVVHIGPSTVGVDTLLKSKGRIPETFLRGCGVAEELIACLPSLRNSHQAIQRRSCFISYSDSDEAFARQLDARMREERLRVWLAPEAMKGGREIHRQIDDEIRLYDKLLLVLSEHSLATEWLATEFYHARQRESREGKRILFPICLVRREQFAQWSSCDPDTDQDLGQDIREYSLSDFSDWKDRDAFEAAFTRLLENLGIEERAASPRAC